MLEGRLEELWDEYYTPPLEKAERYLSAEVPDASRWDSPQLSVVIPVYNVQEYLLPCLRSVLAATEGIERELILVKIRVSAEERQNIISLTEIFRANIVDVARDSVICEVTGARSKLEAFLSLLEGYEVLELARTGVTGLSRGTDDVTYL